MWTRWKNRRALPPVAGLVLQFETKFKASGASWTDRKSGFVASQGTGPKQPTYSPADAAFKGRPSLSGTVAAATQLTNTTDTPFSAGATRTMYFVFQGTIGAGNDGTLMDSRHAATGRVEWLWGDLSGSTWLYTDSVAINQTIPTVGGSLTAPHYLSLIWTSGAQVQAWLDGVSQVVTGGNPATDVAAAGFDLFSRQNGGNPFEGKMLMALGFTGAHSTSDRQLVEKYMQQEGGF